MSGKSFEHRGRDAGNAMQAPDLRPLRAAAEQQELAEVQGRLADGLGNPLHASDPRRTTAWKIAPAHERH